MTVGIELHVVQLARSFLRRESAASIDPDDVDITIFIDIDFWIHCPSVPLRNLCIIHQNKMTEGIPATTVFAPIPISVRADIFLILARNLIDCVSGVSHRPCRAWVGKHRVWIEDSEEGVGCTTSSGDVDDRTNHLIHFISVGSDWQLHIVNPSRIIPAFNGAVLDVLPSVSVVPRRDCCGVSAIALPRPG